MLFQLVQIEVKGDGRVAAATPTQPLFELQQDAAAMAEFAAARSGDDYGYDADSDCWWASRGGRSMLLFIVRPTAASLEAAA